MITSKQINELLGITETYNAPKKLMDILYDKEKREKLFFEFLKLEEPINEEWFRKYFEDEHADRKEKKQDFTPSSVIKLLSRLSDNENNSTIYDCCSGNGGIVIQKWYDNMIKISPFTYKPSNYIHVCEEMSERSIPFLLFNLAIRGMNAIVINCDVISRGCYGIFYVHNENDDYLGFSNINLMPYTKEIENEFKVNFVEHRYKELKEDKNLFGEVK
jgi:hypothetical protein